MKWLRHIAFFCLLLILISAAAYAEPQKDYEDARDVYDAALACMAAYHNRLGDIGFSRLEQDGWGIQYFEIKKDIADAKFVFVERNDSRAVTAMLAIAGTETKKDVRSDFQYGLVPYGGSTFEGFDAKAAEKNPDKTIPKIHRGFNQVTQVALTADILEGPGEQYIADHLLANPTHKLIIAGHSLGGATATLYGARLLSMGVHPDQIKVITFGAPAVGNKAFVDLYQNSLNLTRVVMSGDVVTSVLQDVIHEYEQFGNCVQWTTPDNVVTHPHQIPVYVNVAAKNFYQKRQQAIQAGVLTLPTQTLDKGGPKVYVAPIKNMLSADLQSEFFFMNQALQDEYRAIFPAYLLAEGTEGLNASFDNAAAAGCDWLVTAEVEGRPIKNNDAGVFAITINQSVYSVKGRKLADLYSSRHSTERTTPVVAFINGIRQMRTTANYPFLDRPALAK